MRSSVAEDFMADESQHAFHDNKTLCLFVNNARKSKHLEQDKNIQTLLTMITVYWCNSAIEQISALFANEITEKEKKHNIARKKHNLARTGIEQAADLPRCFLTVEKFSKKLVSKKQLLMLTRDQVKTVLSAASNRLKLKKKNLNDLIDFCGNVPENFSGANL